MYDSVDYSNQYTSSTQYIPPAVPNLPPFSAAYAAGGTPPPPIHAPGFGFQPPPPGAPYPGTAGTPPFPMGTPPGASPHGTPRTRNLSSRRVYPPASTPRRSAPAPANPLANPLPGQALLGVSPSPSSSRKASFSTAFSMASASPHAAGARGGTTRANKNKGTGKLEQHIPNPNAANAKIRLFGTFMIDRVGINGNDPMSNPARHLNIIGRAVNELPLPLQVDRDGSPAVIGCFNCGGDHRINECTYRRNHQCVTLNRTLRQQVTASATKRQHFRSRYFVEQEGTSGFSPKNEAKIQSKAPPPLQLFDNASEMPSSSKQERVKQEKRSGGGDRGRSSDRERGRGPANGRGRVGTPNGNGGQRQRQAPSSSQSAQRWVQKRQDHSSPAAVAQHRGGGGGGGYAQRHHHQQQFQTPPPRQHHHHQRHHQQQQQHQQYRPRSAPRNHHHQQQQDHIGYGRGGGNAGGMPNKHRAQHHTDYSYGSARARQGYGQIQRGGSGGRRNRY